MSVLQTERCEHNTGTVIFSCVGFSIVKCDWGCGEYLIELNLGNHTVKTLTAAEIIEILKVKP